MKNQIRQNLSTNSIGYSRSTLLLCASLAGLLVAPITAFGQAEAVAEVKTAQLHSRPVQTQWQAYAVRVKANRSTSRGVKRIPELPVRKPVEIRPPIEQSSAEEAENIVAADPVKPEITDKQVTETAPAAVSPSDNTTDSKVVFLSGNTEPLVNPNDVITTQAEETKPQNTETEQPPEGNPDPHNPLLETDQAQTPPQDRGEEYCSNITDAAKDARFAWQKQILEETEQELQKRIATLEERIADYKTWVERRDVFVKRAQQSITDIYAKMNPTAAAQQLTAIDEETAAAVLMTLNPRISSAVMAEMEANKAARLTTIISLSAKGPKEPTPAPPAERQGT